MSNRIVVVIGPHEGVGKTTLAANLAARMAAIHHQSVILIDADALCRGEGNVIAGTPSATSIYEIVDQLATKQLNLAMLRGRIPVNRHNIGTVNLLPRNKESDHLSPEQWGGLLQAFSQVYDLVIDLEVGSPFKAVTLDVADAVVWTMSPNALAVRSTVQQLEALDAEKVGFHKFLFCLNALGAPEPAAPEAVEDALRRFNRGLSAQLPYEPEIARALNQGKPSVIDNPRTAYFQAVNKLVERVARYRREQSGPSIFSPAGRPLGAAGAAGPVSLQASLVDGMLLEKRKRWDGIKQRLHRDLVEELNIRRIDLDTKGDPARERQLRTNVESTVNGLIGKDQDLSLSRDERDKLVKELVDEALGLGPLEELLADPTVTEIMVNRFDQVFIERRGKIMLSDKRFLDNNHVIQVVRRIIAPLGRRIDESVPMVDARLKDGSRVNAIIPPLAVQGPSVTIRRFPEKAFTGEDLMRLGSMSRDMIEFLRIAVLLKRNIVISGGTGTGKTTILNMLSGFIPNDERIVTVEDTAELRLQQEHIVRLEARPANIEGQGQVTIRDLVKNCLRMRPDRIVVGECRGGEALDMLQAMNTGHEGSLTTVHANSPRDAFTRLETLCLMAGMDLPVWALREQIRSAVHLVVQLTRLQDGSRRVTGITEVTGRNDEMILTQDLFRFVQDGVDAQGKVLGRHEPAGHLPTFMTDLRAKGLSLDPEMFQRKESAA